MSKNKIYIFTMDSCHHCTSLKKRLSDINIEYVEIEVNLNRDLWDTVVKQVGTNFVPTIFIKPQKSDNGAIYVPTKDFQTEDEIVEIIKSSI